MTYAARLHDTCIGMEVFPGNPCRCCCEGCLYNCSAHNPDHSTCPQPKRYWWYARGEWEWTWWRFVYLGNDEWCNRTIVFRLWRPLVIALNVPLRTETCEKELAWLLGEEEEGNE